MPDREGDFARREFLTLLDAWSLANDDEVIGSDVGNLLGQPIRPTKSEALVIHFSDGSIIGIDTGSNARI
jgi:hypothetical protein